MKKGISGVNLTFFAVVAFLLTIADQTLLGWLLVGFALVVEKDEWLSEQTMTAAVLGLIVDLFSMVVSKFFSLIDSFFGQSSWAIIHGLQILQQVINQLVFWIVLILCIVCATMVSNGKSAEIPGVSGMVRKALGILPVYVHPQAPVQPQYQPQPQPPVQPQSQPEVQLQQSQPQPQTPVQQVSEPSHGSHCPFCGAKVGADERFCMKCGNRLGE